jgi:hypothetical protein
MDPITKHSAPLRIALHGLARTGKDTVGAMLREMVPSLKRVAFGDIIKGDLDDLVRKHLGFSAFTENDEQKKQIREVLVHWGYANYTSVERRFFDSLPLHAVNTRLFRAREAELWIQAGGVVWEVVRPNTKPAEPREMIELQECRDKGFITANIWNGGTLDDLRVQVLRAVRTHYPHIGA